MYEITKWVKEVALARHGLNEDQIREVVRSSRGGMPEWAKPILGERGVHRIMALDSLASGFRSMDGEEFVEAMTTANFVSYFTDALSRKFYSDYSYRKGSWTAYTYPDTAPDFRDVKRRRMTEPGTLHKRREKGETTATHISDSYVAFGVDEYSEQFDVSWRAILNDDLGKIRQTPQRMLNAVNRFEDGWVSALYDNATSQAALIALGANYAGTGRLTTANLAIGINAMKQRTDVNGNLIQINGLWLVIPPILEMQAQTILGSALQSGVATNDLNVIPKFIQGYMLDPYIATAPPNVPWYLFASPSEVPGVTVARLQGWNSPVVYMKRSNIEVITGSAPAAFLMGSFETGDIEYAVSDVIGGWDDATYVGITDPNGIYYSSGTTP